MSVSIFMWREFNDYTLVNKILLTFSIVHGSMFVLVSFRKSCLQFTLVKLLYHFKMKYLMIIIITFLKRYLEQKQNRLLIQKPSGRPVFTVFLNDTSVDSVVSPYMLTYVVQTCVSATGCSDVRPQVKKMSHTFWILLKKSHWKVQYSWCVLRCVWTFWILLCKNANQRKKAVASTGAERKFRKQTQNFCETFIETSTVKCW